MIFRLSRMLAGLLAIAALAACDSGREAEAPPRPGGLVISVEDVAAPEVFALEAEARVAHPNEGAGRWAAVPGLDRPERARVENLATGRMAEVALFRSAPEGGPVVSAEAARALGLAVGGTSPVRIKAIRSEIRLAAPGAGS